MRLAVDHARYGLYRDPCEIGYIEDGGFLHKDQGRPGFIRLGTRLAGRVPPVFLLAVPALSGLTTSRREITGQ